MNSVVRKNKIVFVLPSLKMTAPIKLACQVANKLIDENWDVTILYFSGENKTNLSCKIMKISFFSRFNFDDYDIVHSHMLRPDIYTLFYKKNTKPMFISTVHNDIKEVLKSYYGKLFAFILARIWFFSLKYKDHIILLTDFYLSQLKLKYPNKNLLRIYNGISVNSPKYDILKQNIVRIKKFSNNKKVIGVISNLYTIKGINQIIQVLPSLENYVLIIIGNGPEYNSLLNLSIDLKVSSKCLFLGHIEHAEMYNTFFDVFVMSSYSEGFGLSVLEAAKYKKAVVCSEIEVFNELFTSDEVVFFELYNFESLKNAILNAYSRRLELGQNIYTKFITTYTSNIMENTYLDFYNKILLT